LTLWGYPGGMSDDLDKLRVRTRTYLQRLADLANVRPGVLAVDIGKPHTTVTRYTNDEKPAETLMNLGTLFLVEEAAINRLSKLLQELPTDDRKRQFAYKIQEFADWAEKNGFAIRARLGKILAGWTDEQETNLTRVRVTAHVAAGDWRLEEEWADPGEQYDVWTPQLGFNGLRRHGLEVRGNSMNRVYPEGTVVVYVNIHELGREPRHGERVIVRRTRIDGLKEATCKEYRLVDGLIWLWPLSDDPLHQTPINPANPGQDIESVDIIGLVISSVRPEAVE
jgi:SOS-response transcriptional repressor LexA